MKKIYRLRLISDNNDVVEIVSELYNNYKEALFNAKINMDCYNNIIIDTLRIIKSKKLK